MQMSSITQFVNMSLKIELPIYLTDNLANDEILHNLYGTQIKLRIKVSIKNCI